MNQVTTLSFGQRLSASASACMLLWVSRVLLGLLIAYPLVSALDATGIFNGPERDAVLFQPGALLLLELVRVGMPLLAAASKTALVLYASCAALELLPLSCALDLLCCGAPGFTARIGRAVRVFPRFLALSAILLTTQAALLLATSLLAGALKSALQKADPRVLSTAPLGLFALGLLAATWLSGVFDLARAALVQHDLPWRAALMHALTRLLDEPLAVLSGSFASAAGSVAAYLTAAWLMTGLTLTGTSGVPIVLAFSVHQLTLLMGIAWRVRWLNRALALSAALPSSIGD